jgi:hypothetical protein
MDQQGDVHRYYLTTATKPDEELLRIRAELGRADPSLPQRASKAFIRIYQAFCFAYEHAQGDETLFFQLIRNQTPVKPGVTNKAGQAFLVRPLVQPQPDVKKLAAALLLLAEQQSQARVSPPPDEAPDEPAGGRVLPAV